MTSPSPLQYNTYYHIFNRGVNRTNIFIEDDNYAHFLNLYTDYITPIAETYAYCLLRNHFHLLIRTKSEEELSTEQTLRVSLANPDHQMPASRARLDHKKPAKPLAQVLCK